MPTTQKRTKQYIQTQICLSNRNRMDIIRNGDKIHNDILTSRCFIGLMCLPNNHVLSIQGIYGCHGRRGRRGMRGIWGWVNIVAEYRVGGNRYSGVGGNGSGVSRLIFGQILPISGNLDVESEKIYQWQTKVFWLVREAKSWSQLQNQNGIHGISISKSDFVHWTPPYTQYQSSPRRVKRVPSKV